nr:hypothetical protein [Tanacetum cinerariifolium]
MVWRHRGRATLLQFQEKYSSQGLNKSSNVKSAELITSRNSRYNCVEKVYGNHTVNMLNDYKEKRVDGI